MVFQLVQINKLTGEDTCWRNFSRLIEDTIDQSDKSENENDDEEDIIDMNTYALCQNFRTICCQ